MKHAPTRVTSRIQAADAEVLDKPYIYWSKEWDGFLFISSASRSRNTKATNYCTRINNAIYLKKKCEYYKQKGDNNAQT